jgi:hypothetical protein
MRSTPTLAGGATYTVSGGAAGTVILASESSPHNAFLYNNQNSWTANVLVRVTATLSSEL